MVSALISAEELSQALVTSPPTLLDVRWALGGPPGRLQYERGHIPGAQFVDLDRDLAGPPGRGGRHPMPDAARFVASMRRHGVSARRPVVAYDASTGLAAARVWWLLRYFGHPSVRVLDGGFSAWGSSAARVATGDGPSPVPGDFEGQPGHMPMLDASAAAALAREGILLDARAPERFRGEIEPVDRVAGHIPGARNLPTAGNVGSDGRFLVPEALASRFREAGADGTVAVGAYCGSGVTAAHEVLAADVAGIEAALYVGSWSEWISDSRREVAVGDQPGTNPPTAQSR
jgi:thiosulfate/3-mercaptopyruvate sulfurtransferase